MLKYSGFQEEGGNVCIGDNWNCGYYPADDKMEIKSELPICGNPKSAVLFAERQKKVQTELQPIGVN
jgi:hypothetical protein